jgi:hypothetical protein
LSCVLQYWFLWLERAVCVCCIFTGDGWHLIRSVLAVVSFAVYYLNKYIHTFFFAIWFRARLWVRWIVFVVSVFVLVFFYLLGLDLKPLVAGINCIIFNCYKKVNWVRLMSPQFCTIFYFMFNIFGIVQWVSSALFLLKKKSSTLFTDKKKLYSS